MNSDSKRFVAKGRSGMCLAVYGGRGVDVASAVNACNDSFLGGRLLSNDRWSAFVKAHDNSKALLKYNKTMYVGFSPDPEIGCFVIDEYLKATLEDPCQMEPRSFVCEYPRNEFCRWEVMLGDTPVRSSDGKWELKTQVVQLQEVDGSKDSCKPNDEATPISNWKAACRPLYNDTWSQRSECGSCGNQHLQGYQYRNQAPNDRCKRLVGGVHRYHTRSCFQMTCSTDVSTEGGVSVIFISHLPMLFVFLSMFSY